MFTSTHLDEGRVYTRQELQDQFGITDATIRTGIFQPAGHESVWLFVTETKTPDRTQYADKLDGDTLDWDGQTEGRKDPLIIEHARRGLELLLFYRESRRQYPGAGFVYEGRFAHISHTGSRPTHFVLRRVNPGLERAERDIAALIAEESYEEGGRSLVLVNRYERDGKVRTAAIAVHGLRCQGCGFSFAEVYGERGAEYIEAHHLRPISSYEGVVRVDPVRDMAVVCANCHRMIHREARQPLSLDELRRMIATNRDTTSQKAIGN